MADLTPQIEENAQQPRSMTVGAENVQQHSLLEQIEADRYLKDCAAAASPKRGFNLQRFKPPGSV